MTNEQDKQVWKYLSYHCPFPYQQTTKEFLLYKRMQIDLFPIPISILCTLTKSIHENLNMKFWMLGERFDSSWHDCGDNVDAAFGSKKFNKWEYISSKRKLTMQKHNSYGRRVLCQYSAVRHLVTSLGRNLFDERVQHWVTLVLTAERKNKQKRTVRVFSFYKCERAQGLHLEGVVSESAPRINGRD